MALRNGSSSGSFGYLGVHRQGSPAVNKTSLGGTIRLPVLSRITERATLGNIGASLPSSSNLSTNIGASGASVSTQAQALGASTATTLPSNFWLWVSVGAVLLIGFVFVSR
jgi:purine-cytosine permease-like protein